MTPIPFTVVGGFLGAGKTTVLGRLLADPHAPRCLLLVNDFGDIAIDAALIKARGGDTISLTNGCVCCTMGNDLGAAIGAALDRRPAPQRIVVEASGVADPAAVAAVAHLSRELTAGGVPVVADGAAVVQQLHDRWIGDTVHRQLAAADCLLISKLDTMSPAAQVDTLAALTARYPATPQWPATDLRWVHVAPAPPRPSPTADTPHARFHAVTLHATNPVSITKLRRFLADHPKVYRLKGWRKTSRGAVQLLQAAGGHLAVTPDAHPIDDYLIAVAIGHPRMPPAEEILRCIER